MKRSRGMKALAVSGAVALALCTGVGALAADPLGTTPKVTKTLQMAEGMAVPSATFKFTITKVTADAPAAQVADITYDSSSAKGNLTNGVYLIEKSQQITFGTFPHAGQYTYQVKEINESAANPNVTYASNSYYLDVYVVNTASGGLEIANTVARDDDGDKVGALSFLNTYARKDASLTVSKQTVGSGANDLADKTKDFDFTITMYRAATDTTASYTGKIDKETITLTFDTSGKASASFKLHDGETLKFTGLAAGTRYTVEEAGAADDYTPSVSVVENGTATVTQTASNEASGITTVKESGATNLVGEGTNKAAFTNTYKSVPITGVILNNLPALVLLGAAVCALAVVCLGKRRVRR